MITGIANQHATIETNMENSQITKKKNLSYDSAELPLAIHPNHTISYCRHIGLSMFVTLYS